MEETHYKIQVAPDHVQRLCGGTPARAISELVWNSLDADSTKVQATTLDNEFGTATLIVRDNGHGIPYRNIKKLFVNLGGSWKAQAAKTKLRGRALHGKEGKGIYRATQRGQSTHMRARTEALVRELASGGLKVESEKADMLRAQNEVRHAWNAIGDILMRQRQPELAHQVRQFVDRIPPANTEKEMIAAHLLEQVRANAKRDRSSPTR